jgi:hypothetical protein
MAPTVDIAEKDKAYKSPQNYPGWIRTTSNSKLPMAR